MTALRLVTLIRAPVDVCFDLARSVDAHVASTARTREVAVAGVTSGLLTLGDEVTWEATHFGVRQRLRVRITAFEPPRTFTDEMVTGAFRRMRHVHTFEATPDGTVMTDEFDFEAPLGPLGWLAEVLVLKRYMTGFLLRRNVVLKSAAEEAGRAGA
jgi:ligand-binding SRPBCC domain-containing protein